MEPNQTFQAPLSISSRPTYCAGADDRDVDLVGVPADAAVGADVPDLEAVRVLERRNAAGHRSRGWFVA